VNLPLAEGSELNLVDSNMNISASASFAVMSEQQQYDPDKFVLPELGLYTQGTLDFNPEGYAVGIGKIGAELHFLSGPIDLMASYEKTTLILGIVSGTYILDENRKLTGMSFSGAFGFGFYSAKPSFEYSPSIGGY
jgi:hypothetical protein